MPLSQSDEDDLKYAKKLLEHPGLAVKLGNLIGTPIEKGLDFLPARWTGTLHRATTIALRRALRFAVLTMGGEGNRRAAIGLHKGLVVASGGVGGAFGLPALIIELPVSTVIMLRAIAAIAASEGERLKDSSTRVACLEVFALGGGSRADDAGETGYFAIRAALARAVSEATGYIAEKGLADKGAPALVRLISQIASRFNVVVTQKAAAQAVPVIGAASAMGINAIFIDHFQKMARGHFIIRRLERHHGTAMVRAAYDRL